MTNVVIEGVVGGVVLGLVVGLIIGYSRRKGGETLHYIQDDKVKNQDDSVGLIEEKEEKKAENVAKLKDFIAASTDRITNDQVQKLLGVSDATAERYLDQMEKEGMVQQIGKEGKYTYYSKP